MDTNVIARFWAKVDKRGPDECWLWTGSTVPGTSGDYGQMRAGELRGEGRRSQRAMMLAHRISYTIATGTQPERGQVVMHSCDRTLCCNPAHLSLGTHTDNMRDMYAKGRRHSRAGLKREYWPAGTKVAVLEMLAAGHTKKSIARELGVSRQGISYLQRISQARTPAALALRPPSSTVAATTTPGASDPSEGASPSGPSP